MAHIIVIGGGASGLMAARALTAKHAITLLEARSNLGGRIEQVSTGFSKPVQTGAEFIHGQQPITFSLLKEAGLKTRKLSGKHFSIYKGELDTGDLLDDDWNKLTRELNKLKRDTDIATFLHAHFHGDPYAGLREKVTRFVEGYDIADVHRVSAIALRDEWADNGDMEQYHIEGGYEPLIQFLAEELTAAGAAIHVDAIVTRVVWGAGKVTVTTSSGDVFVADQLIVTVPLGVLLHRDIVFDPPLPAHEDAIADMGFGNVIKFMFEFKSSFWEQCRGGKLRDLSFIFSDAKIPTWWTQRPDTTPLLTGWLGGPVTRQLPNREGARYAYALESLQYIFDCPASLIEEQLLHFHITDWSRDPFARGAYGYTTVQTPRARRLLNRAVDETLFFAGEALYEGNGMGTVEAALGSGLAVAKRILKRK